MPVVANPYTYVAGFMTGAVMLHIIGVVIGDISQHYEKGKLMLRLAGGGIAGTGLWFLVGAA